MDRDGGEGRPDLSVAAATRGSAEPVLPAAPAEPGEPAPRRRPGPFGDRAGLATWGVTAAATLGVLVVRNLSLLGARINSDGDFAANAILIDKALQWRLLVGNYSRVGFNHPGPALLYVQGWSQWFFHDLTGIVPSAFGAQFLGILILNAVLIGGVAVLFRAHTGSTAVTVAGVAALLLFATREQQLLTSTWMPDVYFAPFLLFTVALASFLSGRWRTLPWVAFAGSLLVHGHASFLGFVGPAMVLLVVVAFVRHRHDLSGVWRRERRPLLVSAGIAAVFAVPIVLNVLLHFPGEFGKYLRYIRSGQAGAHSISSIVDYGLGYWNGARGHNGQDLALVLVLGAVSLALVESDREIKRFFAWLLGVAGVMSLLFLNYGLKGIDNLSERYIGLFYLGIPSLVVAVIAMGGVRLLMRSRLVWMGPAVMGAAALALVVGLRSAPLANPYRGDARLPQLDQLLADAPARAGRPVALTFPSEAWPLSVGLMEYGQHHHLRFCAVNPIWDFLVTPGFICSPAEATGGFQVAVTPASGLGAGAPTGTTLFADAQHVLTATP